MHRARAFWVILSCLLSWGASPTQAEQATSVQPPMDPAKQAAMEAMQRLGSPSEGHKALEPFVGSWTYTLEWWMSPDAPPESMTGTTTNSLIFGDRFLKQEVHGEGEAEGHPPFEGIGFTGYDNIRQEYQSVWFDSVGTGIHQGNTPIALHILRPLLDLG